MDDYIENYIALLACIISRKSLSPDVAIRRVLDQKVKTASDIKSSGRFRNILLIDKLENKEYRFFTGAAAARVIGMPIEYASAYVSNGYTYKNRYVLKRIKEKS